MQCIPSIDLRRGRVVRLQQGDLARLRDYDLDPVVLAGRYAAAGARRLHVVDLDGAAGEGENHAVIRRLCAVSGLEVQAGGGVRDAAGLEAFFACGAAAVVVGSVAAKDPALVRSWLRLHGGQRLVLALDVSPAAGGAWDVRADAWRRSAGVSLWGLLERYADAGLQTVLCTDVSRDGLLQGPNLDLYRACLARFPRLGWQASGGVSGPADLAALAALGVPAAILGRALLEGRVAHEVLGEYRGAA